MCSLVEQWRHSPAPHRLVQYRTVVGGWLVGTVEMRDIVNRREEEGERGRREGVGGKKGMRSGSAVHDPSMISVTPQRLRQPRSAEGSNDATRLTIGMKCLMVYGNLG